jgi:peptidoglycan/xylan/chitin deacetylase (PgdA/CDA1 family)
MINEHLRDYFRLPDDLQGGFLSARPSGDPGFFRFGPRAICYGRCATGSVAKWAGEPLHDAADDVLRVAGGVSLPFNPAEIIDNLRKEHYARHLFPEASGLVGSTLVRKAYYGIRGLLSIPIRRRLQKMYFNGWEKLSFPAWPVDFTVDNLHEEFLRLSMKAKGIQRVPFIWFWPNGAKSCLLMTHDVESPAGRDFVPQLMDLDDAHGLKAAFQVIPEERYEVPDDYVRQIRERGFEFNIHDLNHDGHLYLTREEFVSRAKKINDYALHYKTEGFRAGAMYRNQDWYDAFKFSYDMSVPNVAHLEPMRGGCCTVMPYFIGNILELPLTTVQDYSLFYILDQYSIDLWTTQLDLIRQRNGLMSFITHPDYLIDSRNRKVYESLLVHLKQIVQHENIWATLPMEVYRWWRARNQMELIQGKDGWKIEGLESERARLAFATIEDNHITYHVE